MRTASKGALPLPAVEMLEILVYLTQNPVFAQDARMTLAGWDLESARTTIQDPNAPPEVIGYYWSEQNRRPALMPSLIENPAVSENMLIELASTCSREIVNMLMMSPRVLASPVLVEALSTNYRLLPEDHQRLRGESGTETLVETNPAEVALASAEPKPADHESEAAAAAWQQEHAHEIAAEEGKAFELVGEDDSVSGETPSDSAGFQSDDPATPASQANVVAPSTSSESLAISAMAMHGRAEAAAASQPERLTLMQRVSRLNAAERVKTAFMGGKEERAILIRDGARVVQNAVLASPKLTDPEVETFASQKNVSENVLREIARNRRFMKHYAVVKNLVLNPKTPLDISMPLVKMLMVYDLKALQHSKNVSEGIRRLAVKYYKEKATSGGKTRD